MFDGEDYMYTLIIGRAFPAKETGMMGIFEFEQAVALKRHGMNTVYAFCDTRSIKALKKINYQSFIQKEVPVYGYHFPIGGIPRKLFDKLKLNKYKKLLKNIVKVHGKPAYIHIHFPLLTLNKEIWDILKEFHIPIIVTEHWSKIQFKIIEKYRVELLKKIVEEAKTFICVSDLLKKSVIELTNSNKEILVIPNMLNEHFYYDKSVDRTDSEFNFIAIGRIVEVKRFIFTVEAFYKAFPNEEHIKLHIVGDGPLYNKVKEKVKNLNIENRVIMHGFLSRKEIANLLRRSDVFVSASVLETFGVPFIEAMACGKPVIGIKGGPIDKYITKDIGVLFEKDNINSLILNLNYMYKMKNNYNEEMISNVAISNFSKEAVSKQVLLNYK